MTSRFLKLGGAAMFNPANLGNASGVATPPSTAAGINGDSGDMSGAGGGAGNWASNIKNLQVLASQADCNEKAGRLLAASNYKYVELRITSPANYLGAFDIVPSLGFYQWGLADALFKRGLGLNGKKLICRNVTANMVEGGVMQTSVVFEIEAIGENGIPGNYPAGYPTPVTTTPVNGPETTASGGYLISYSGSALAAFITTAKVVNASVTVDAAAYTDLKITALSNTKAFNAIVDAVGQIKVSVLNLSGTTIAPNALVDYDTPLGTGTLVYKADTIDATHGIISYRYSGGGIEKAYCIAGEVSGNSSTPGSKAELNAKIFGNNEVKGAVSVSVISSVKAIAAWCETTALGQYDWYARILTISGTSITPENYAQINDTTTATSANNNGAVAALSGTVAVAVYTVLSAPAVYDTYAIPITITGNVITTGSDVLVIAGFIANNFGLAKISSTSFIYVWDDVNIKAIAGSIAAGVITLGAAIDLNNSTGANYPTVTVNSAGTQATVVFADSGGSLQRRTVTISGTTLTDLDDDTTNSDTITSAMSISLIP